MKFHIDHIPAKQGFEIAHHHALFLIGSCFSENIGRLLQASKFRVYNNPSGILFNPLSIYNSLNGLLHLKPFEEKYTLKRDATVLSYLHHSSVHSEGQAQLIKHIDSENKTAHAFLKNADYLIITFGTAYYYQHLALDTAVANCHKQPAQTFEKRLLQVPEIVSLYTSLAKQLQELKPGMKLIFTVSPVKHLKDGLVENTISKSTLVLAIHQLTQQVPNCFYFPAYELVNDDLRDYRFYNEDMAHPNEQAIDYVWQKFSGCYFSSKTISLNAHLAKLNAALNHRDRHGSSEENAKLQAFIAKQKEEIKKLDAAIEF